MTAPRSGNRNAFTLAELLLVLLIFAVLAAILLPAISSISGKAGQVRCLNNLRQVSSGLLAFVAENRGNFMYCYNVRLHPETGVATHGIFWGGILNHRGYVGDPDLFFCETNKTKYWKTASYAAGLRHSENDSAWSYISYGANRYGLMPSWSDGLRPARRSEIEHPSDTLMLIEVSNPYNANGYDGLEWLSSASAASVGKTLRAGGQSTEIGPSRRHGRSVNVAFVDGRVEMHDLAHGPMATFSSSAGAPWYEGVHTAP